VSRRNRQRGVVVNGDGVMYCVNCGDDVWTYSYDIDIRADILHFRRCIPCIAKGQASGELGPGLDGGTYEEAKRG
jgi:hypothetical protein